jgi:2-oxoglutarate ferredoxin oxidoreductase subunit gamma
VIREVIMAGFGGQGIMLMGKVLAMSTMLDNKHVTWFPSYGAEMRGGTANCTVIISDQTIGSPIVSRPWASIVMNQPSMERFAPRVKQNGLLLINSSLIKVKPQRDDLEVLALPVTDMADNLGTVKVANIIALAAFCAKTKVVSWENLEKAMEESVSSKKNRDILEINRKAILIGREMVSVPK